MMGSTCECRLMASTIRAILSAIVVLTSGGRHGHVRLSAAPVVGLLLVLVLVLSGCASNQSLPPDSDGLYESGMAGSVGSWTPQARADRLWQVFNRYEGAPYHYGGTSASGFDCSGFIMTAYREALGVRLPRTTSQMLAMGEPVQPDNLQPGDLVFFHLSGKDGHAGIYMGSGRFIHASSSSGVIDSSLNSRYWRRHFSQARRF